MTAGCPVAAATAAAAGTLSAAGSGADSSFSGLDTCGEVSPKVGGVAGLFGAVSCADSLDGGVLGRTLVGRS